MCCVRAACACTPPEIVAQAQLVALVDGGVGRPLARAVPGSAAELDLAP